MEEDCLQTKQLSIVLACHQSSWRHEIVSILQQFSSFKLWRIKMLPSGASSGELKERGIQNNVACPKLLVWYLPPAYVVTRWRYCYSQLSDLLTSEESSPFPGPELAGTPFPGPGMVPPPGKGVPPTWEGGTPPLSRSNPRIGGGGLSPTRTASHVLATKQAVSLLSSRRRTVLLYYIINEPLFVRSDMKRVLHRIGVIFKWHLNWTKYKRTVCMGKIIFSESFAVFSFDLFNVTFPSESYAKSILGCRGANTTYQTSILLNLIHHVLSWEILRILVSTWPTHCRTGVSSDLNCQSG